MAADLAYDRLEEGQDTWVLGESSPFLLSIIEGLFSPVDD